MSKLNANLHISASEIASYSRGDAFEWVSIGGTLSLHFPEGVPTAKLVAIADAINDALDTARAHNQQEAA